MILQFIVVASGVTSLKGRSGDNVVSYMLWVILKTSITSPRKGPYFRVGRFKYINLSMYDIYFAV